MSAKWQPLCLNLNTMIPKREVALQQGQNIKTGQYFTWIGELCKWVFVVSYVCGWKQLILSSDIFCQKLDDII